MSLHLSVLDLAPVASGSTPADAVRRTVELAQLAERLGYVRYWFAEHHSLPSVASSAPEILIAHIAAATQRIRVGSGGIMLPNHAPLRIAEAFRTLAALHPDRIDLGIGRAPGSDAHASRALRAADGEHFPAQLAELFALTARSFPSIHPLSTVRAMPEDVPLPPVWLLGSSGASARYAGELGRGYSFASHFSPMPVAPVFEAYRRSFRPSAAFPQPHTILGASVVCAETDERAEYLAATLDLARLRLLQRITAYQPLPSPEEALAYPYTEADRQLLQPFRELYVIGSPSRVMHRLDALAADSGADEIMVVSNIHDHAARLRSYELLAATMNR